MRPFRPCAVGVAVAIALAGCTDDEPATSSTEGDGTTDGVGRELTDDEAEAALPDAPEGLDGSAYEIGAEDRKTDPEECLDLLRLGPEAERLRDARSGFAGITYSNPSGPLEEQQSYTISIASHPDPIGPDVLSQAGEALGQCSAFSFTGTDASGNFDERILAEGIPVKNLGDQTFAVRLTSFPEIDGDVHRQYVDQIDVRVGHTLVSVRSTGYRENDDTQDIEEMAQQILDDLEK